MGVQFAIETEEGMMMDMDESRVQCDDKLESENDESSVEEAEDNSEDEPDNENEFDNNNIGLEDGGTKRIHMIICRYCR